MIETIHVERVTHMIMVPAQIVAVLNHPAFAPEKLASLEMLQNLGAPLHLEFKQRINAVLPGRFYELYGLTEGLMTVLDKQDACPSSARSAAHRRSWTSNPAGGRGECGPGEAGEICGRSPCLMSGYYKRPDLTAKAIVDGWLHSGDAGYLDEDGYLYRFDRIKDMIISVASTSTRRTSRRWSSSIRRCGRPPCSALPMPGGAKCRWRPWC